MQFRWHSGPMFKIRKMLELLALVHKGSCLDMPVHPYRRLLSRSTNRPEKASMHVGVSCPSCPPVSPVKPFGRATESSMQLVSAPEADSL